LVINSSYGLTLFSIVFYVLVVLVGEVLPKEDQTIPVGANPKRKSKRKPQQFEDRSNENS